jgi:hypothetical protein
LTIQKTVRNRDLFYGVIRGSSKVSLLSAIPYHSTSCEWLTSGWSNGRLRVACPQRQIQFFSFWTQSPYPNYPMKYGHVEKDTNLFSLPPAPILSPCAAISNFPSTSGGSSPALQTSLTSKRDTGESELWSVFEINPFSA